MSKGSTILASIGIALAILLLLVAAITIYMVQRLNSPVALTNSTFLVKPGSTLPQVARSLAEQGVIEVPAELFRYYGMVTRAQGGSVKAGEYEMSGEMSAIQVLDLLRSGRVLQRQITFIEGWAFADWRRTLAAKPALTQSLAQLDDRQVMNAFGRPGELPEGWFFPDTYQFTRGESDMDVLQRAHRKMQLVLHNEWSARPSGGVLKAPYEALILASMVEKETGAEKDRGLVARVFVNRLGRGIRLQSDPTVIFGLGDQYDGDLNKADLDHESPYNTYRHRGLPPTPIAMPGLASIRAALHPDVGDFLYFVAKGDGTSYFSRTLSEHNDAVERYQRSGRRSDYRSQPQ
jgi:UPF0755 protein